jgi:MoxR-like ATPase
VNATTYDRRIRLLALTYGNRLKAIEQEFVGRDEAVRLIGLAMLCREHVLLVGPPGTAKTALLTRFGELLSTRPFTYLLTKFTEPTELFGPLDIRRFQEEGTYQVNTEGMLPRARVAFLDEVFQGSSAILNTLLTLINERRFHNGSTVEPCELVTLLGSSNDLPDDPVLAAFGDRFLLRCRVDHVPDDEVEDLLGLGWTQERGLIAAAAGPGAGGRVAQDQYGAGFGLDDLAQLQHAVAEVDLLPVRSTYAQIIRDLRAQGIAFSDRRAVKAQKAIAAAALLRGRMEAENDDLGVLMYLWTDGRDEPAMRRIVTDHGVPVGEPGRRVSDVPTLRLDLGQLKARLAMLQSPEEQREAMRLVRRLAAEVSRDHPSERTLLEEANQVLRDAVTSFRERFGEESNHV